MKPILIVAFNIPGAWDKVVKIVLEKGVKQRLQAYDEYALAVYNLLVHIGHPEMRPMACEKAGYTEKMLWDYWANYFFIGADSEHAHSYAKRLKEPVDQYQLVANMLREIPYSRRAVMVISKPEDLLSEYAPCVRELNFYCLPPDYDKINLTVMMRSWDVYSAGNPDLASFQMANEMVAKLADKETGTLTVLATNAHIYKRTLKVLVAMKRDENHKTFLQVMKEVK